MERADVLIVGGGPAGAACAAALTAAGRDVLVVDAAVFPRDKPCAGWITPEVLDEIPFSIDDYAEGHVAQPVARFRLGMIGGRAVDVDYPATVSWGIRRPEFDAELLRRSGARVREGTRVRTVEHRDGEWVVNGSFAAPLLVGAAGHFCPIARHLGEREDAAWVVAAREIEFRLAADDARRCAVEPGRPELYFCRDLKGYGWCFRKGDHLNVGLGHLDHRRLPERVEAFLAFLRREGRIDSLPGDGWRGHAYRVRRGQPRRLSGEGVVLVGDAAGLAAPASGEGILPALVSGRLAAEAIVASRFADYETRLNARLGPPAPERRYTDRLAGILGPGLLAMPGFARRVVLDRWFLHRSSRRGGAVLAP